MKWSLRKVVILMIALVSAAVAYYVAFHRERQVNAKPIADWVFEYYDLTGPEVQNYSQAEQDLCERTLDTLGTNVIPTLLQMAAVRESRFNSEIERFSYEYPSFKRPLEHLGLRHERELSDYRSAAQACFGRLGGQARPAIPAIVGLLTDENPDVAESAAIILRNVGPAARSALPALILAAANTNADVRAQAIQALDCIDPRAAASTASNHLADPDSNVRFFAWQLLSHSRGDPKASIAKVSGILEQTNLSWVACSALLDGLARFGPDAKSAFPVVVPYLTNQHAQLRRAATNAFESLTGVYEPAPN